MKHRREKALSILIVGCIFICAILTIGLALCTFQIVPWPEQPVFYAMCGAHVVSFIIGLFGCNDII